MRLTETPRSPVAAAAGKSKRRNLLIKWDLRAGKHRADMATLRISAGAHPVNCWMFLNLAEPWGLTVHEVIENTMKMSK